MLRARGRARRRSSPALGQVGRRGAGAGGQCPPPRPRRRHPCVPVRRSAPTGPPLAAGGLVVHSPIGGCVCVFRVWLFFVSSLCDVPLNLTPLAPALRVAELDHRWVSEQEKHYISRGEPVLGSATARWQPQAFCAPGRSLAAAVAVPAALEARCRHARRRLPQGHEPGGHRRRPRRKHHRPRRRLVRHLCSLRVSKTNNGFIIYLPAGRVPRRRKPRKAQPTSTQCWPSDGAKATNSRTMRQARWGLGTACFKKKSQRGHRPSSSPG